MHRERLVFSLEEAAYALHKREGDVKALLLTGEIPHYRAGREYRIPRRHLEDWAERQCTGTRLALVEHEPEYRAGNGAR